MSNDLKRVGLVFTQEGAVDFKKSLQEINLELNRNYNQFKLTQAQWDKSTSSTQKLKAQQEYLTNAYELQEDKVKTLKMQLSDLENAEDKNTTAIKKKRNELTNAEVKLENYKKKIKEIEGQLNNTGKKIEEFGTKVENVGDNIEKAGKKVSAFSIATGTALLASARSAIDFEDAFTGVEKTVDGTDEQIAQLKQGIRDMAKEIPSTTTEISAVAEAAGQLGIETDNVLSFTRTMIDMGNATNLSAEQAATTLARFANVTKMSQSDFNKLGSVVVALGNNFATTEAEIAQMGMNLASAGTQVGMNQSQIMALATALSSVGLEAEAGGTAFSKVMVNMQLAVEKGGKSLEDFASVAGISSKDFKKAFKEDATSAIMKFVEGISKSGERGKSAIKILDDMGITETRLRDALLRSANASTIFSKAIAVGSEAWEDNTALTNEANKRYDTLKSKITIAINKIQDLAITFGNKLMPSIQKILDGFGKWIEKFENLSDEQVDMIVKIGLIVTAIGPLISIVGKLTSTIGGLTKGIGTVVQAIGVMQGTATSTSTAVNGLASVFSAITSPIGLACVAIGVAVAGIAVAVNNAEKDTKEAFSNMGDAATDFITGIDNAQSHLSAFNSELFASSEEQQELKNQMDEIQKGITAICKTASDERRGYTQEEIIQLDEYFTKLRELNQRELEIQQSISDAITQQAITNAETFQGSLEEYKTQSQEWLNTAIEQKNKTIELINEQTVEETVLLNQRYGDEANMQNEAYATEYNTIIEQKQAKIDVANKEIAEIQKAYADGYLQRAEQNDGFYNILKEYNARAEEENQKHVDKLVEIETKYGNSEIVLCHQKQANSSLHEKAMKKIWDDMYKNMSDEQEKELGIWLAQVAQTEMYGGEISQETQDMINTIIDSYESMPKETKEAMKNAMSPMLTEMQKSEPTLYSKASGIANGILSRLKKAFDIHSPSKKTKQIFKNVMKRNGKRNRGRRG